MAVGDCVPELVLSCALAIRSLGDNTDEREPGKADRLGAATVEDVVLPVGELRVLGLVPGGSAVAFTDGVDCDRARSSSARRALMRNAAGELDQDVVFPLDSLDSICLRCDIWTIQLVGCNFLFWFMLHSLTCICVILCLLIEE
jgi:hypothetical protein